MLEFVETPVSNTIQMVVDKMTGSQQQIVMKEILPASIFIVSPSNDDLFHHLDFAYLPMTSELVQSLDFDYLQATIPKALVSMILQDNSIDTQCNITADKCKPFSTPFF